jgi:hypothetical protein
MRLRRTRGYTICLENIPSEDLIYFFLASETDVSVKRICVLEWNGSVSESLPRFWKVARHSILTSVPLASELYGSFLINQSPSKSSDYPFPA